MSRYADASESAKEVKRCNNRARNSAYKDLAEMYPAQYAVLYDGYRREALREAFGDPEYRTPLVRNDEGRFASVTESE